MLAALVLSLTGDGGDPERTRTPASPTASGSAAVAEEELTDLVVDGGAACAPPRQRLDGLDEEPVLQLATHLETPERARALYLLSLALGDLEVWERDRLDELLARVLSVLSRPDLTGAGPARSSSSAGPKHSARRRRPAAVDRIATRPRAYLLAPHGAGGRAPGRPARSPAAPGRRGSSRCRSTTTGGARRGRSGPSGSARRGVRRARRARARRRRGQRRDLARGAAVESFRVRASQDPASRGARGDRRSRGGDRGSTAAGRRPRSLRPTSRSSSTTTSSPWYTLCEVRGDDRHGLLHTITVGFAARRRHRPLRARSRPRAGRHRPLRAHRHRRTQARRATRRGARSLAGARDLVGDRAEPATLALRVRRRAAAREIPSGAA